MNKHTATLIGMKSSRYRLLKAELEKAIAAVPYRIQLQEINSVDRILDHALASIPAVMIDGQVIFENGHLLEREELLAHLSDKLDKLLHIRRIVVPVDFSTNSKQAYQFAQALAEHFESRISLLHIVHVYADAGVPETNTLDYAIQQAEGQLQEFMIENQLAATDHLHIDATVKLGFAGDSILQYVEEQEADLVLMGTKGETNLYRHLLGSVSIKVAKESSCPVLLVPSESTYDGFDQILFANDGLLMSKNLELLIERLCDTFQSTPHVVHVNTAPNSSEAVAKETTVTTSESDHLRTVRVEDVSVVEGINTYVSRHDVDLVVLIRQQRNFFDRLFHKSQTKQIAMQANVPLLIFPQ